MVLGLMSRYFGCLHRLGLGRCRLGVVRGKDDYDWFEPSEVNSEKVSEKSNGLVKEGLSPACKLKWSSCEVGGLRMSK